MRYTLRLLTLDQLGRAAGLVCALELERDERRGHATARGRSRSASGSARPPRRTRSGARATVAPTRARSKVNQFKNERSASRRRSRSRTAPGAATKFTPDSFTLLPDADEPRDLRSSARTSSATSSGDRALPILAVDEPIYRRLPCFLIATVDKFAALPVGRRVGRASSAASTGTTRTASTAPASPGTGTPLAGPAPAAGPVIQDELHLISGPLGTMVGLYESALDALVRRARSTGEQVRPKIVASTATVRRAQDQIQALFGRARRRRSSRRRGPTAATRSSPTVPSATELTRAALPRDRRAGPQPEGRDAADLARAHGGRREGVPRRRRQENPDNPADPYMTLLGYFNSLRELGGSAPDRRGRGPEHDSTAYGGRKRIGEKPRALPGPQDRLRGRRADLARLHRQGRRGATPAGASVRRESERVDCAIATNMISVGLDIPRLGLMVVLGQPKTPRRVHPGDEPRRPRPEQARAGRDAAQHPQAPRPLALRAVRHYHESFYRTVEVASVTPFSARALDRGFAGALVGFARHVGSDARTSARRREDR